MTANSSVRTQSTLAKTLAPEDICCGDFVAVLTNISEYPSFLWPCPSQFLAADEVVSIRHRPYETEYPLKVLDICLPFVLVKPQKGKAMTLDVRSAELVRISDHYANSVRKALSKKKRKKTKGKKSK